MPETVKPASTVGNERQLNHAASHEQAIAQQDASQIPPEGNRIKQGEDHKRNNRETLHRPQRPFKFHGSRGGPPVRIVPRLDQPFCKRHDENEGEQISSHSRRPGIGSQPHPANLEDDTTSDQDSQPFRDPVNG